MCHRHDDGCASTHLRLVAKMLRDARRPRSSFPYFHWKHGPLRRGTLGVALELRKQGIQLLAAERCTQALSVDYTHDAGTPSRATGGSSHRFEGGRREARAVSHVVDAHAYAAVGLVGAV